MHKATLESGVVLGAVLFAVVLPTMVVLAEETKEALPVALPPPYFASTPLDYENEHYEGPIFKPRPPFLAPKGGVLLSEGKPVTSSVKPNYGKLEQIVDGKIGPEQDRAVELGPGLQWVQIDLGKQAELYAVAAWHFYFNTRVYFDVVVRIADDAEFTKNVQTIYNNDYDNSTKLGVGENKEYADTFEGRIFDAKGLKGRYVRLYSNGNTTDECNHYIEVQVFGKPL